jgi:hypothetical protein
MKCGTACFDENLDEMDDLYTRVLGHLRHDARIKRRRLGRRIAFPKAARDHLTTPQGQTYDLALRTIGSASGALDSGSMLFIGSKRTCQSYC